MGDGHEAVSELLALLDHHPRLLGVTSPAELAERVADAAREALGHEQVAVYLAARDSEGLQLAHESGWPDAVPEIPPDAEGAAARAMRDLRPVETGEDEGPCLAVPLVSEGLALGVVVVRWAASAPLGADRRALLRALADHASAALSGLHGKDDLERETRRLQAVVECSADAIITTDPKGRITAFNPGAEELFGYSGRELLGTRVADYYLGGEAEARRVQRYLEEDGKVRNYEAWFRTAAGEPLPTSLSASVLRDRDGAILGTLGILKDITVEKRLERRLSYTIEMLQEANENLGRLAVTDALSGLKNQRFFRRKLEEEMLRANRTGRALTLLMIDIDKFKSFNDEHGHQVGDRVIQEMGSTILQSIRQIDHGCRYGGEEFVVLLPETPSANALVVAERIQRSFAGSGAWPELSLEPPTLSIGLAEYHHAGRREIDMDALVKRADDAMYRVKKRGGNDIEVD